MRAEAGTCKREEVLSDILTAADLAVVKEFYFSVEFQRSGFVSMGIGQIRRIYRRAGSKMGYEAIRKRMWRWVEMGILDAVRSYEVLFSTVKKPESIRRRLYKILVT